MTNVTPQPHLPAEIPYTDLEQYFISIQPKNLWPPNQNSNLGLLRMLFTGQLEGASQLLEELANESFLATAEGYLGRWEDELGLPKYQGGRTDDRRRAALLSRREIGPFTNKRRERIIQRYLQETFGSALSFGASGITLGSGVPLHSGAATLDNSYYIIENIPNFSYEVRYLNTVVPDLASLTRELAHITPAHISFTVNPHAFPFHNYALNPGFATGDTSQWGYWVSVGTGGQTVTAVTPFEGAQSGTVNISTNGTIIFSNNGLAPVYPGQRVWMRLGMRTRTGLLTGMGLYGYWFDGNMQVVGQVVVTSHVPVTNTWYTESGVIVAPANAKYCQISSWGGTSAAASYDVDGAMLYPLVGNEPPPPTTAFITD